MVKIQGLYDIENIPRNLRVLLLVSSFSGPQVLVPSVGSFHDPDSFESFRLCHVVEIGAPPFLP